MVKLKAQSELVVAAATEVALVDGEPARRVKLLPIGTIEMRDGRGPFQIRDRAHAQAVVAATREWLGSADLMFDYDHQALYGPRPGVGGTAVAAGWIKPSTLEVADDGIYGQVEWTEAAAAKIKAREYRYVSPTFMVDQERDVVRFKNAALVNIGAIDLPAIAAGFIPGATMSLKAIAAALGLGEDATEEQILAAIQKKNAPSTSPIAIAAGLAENATVEEIAAAVTAAKTPDPKKFVPIEVVTTTTERLNVLEGDRREAIVAAAIKEGKLSPALKQWGLDLIASNEASWNAWYASATPIVNGRSDMPGKDAAGKFTSLTADEIAACEMTGRDPADYLRIKNEEIA
jgi:phage I-like protein